MTEIGFNQAADDRFKIGPSTIRGAGLGLIARRDLAADEELTVVGPRVVAESLEDVCTGFANSHKFRVGNELIIPFGLAGMANHSEVANLRRVIEGERVFLQTIGPVACGEELFLNYSPKARSYFKDLSNSKEPG